MFARVRPYLPTFALAVCSVYFGVHALTGEKGLLKGDQRERVLAERQAQLDRLQAERRDLEARVRLMRDDSLSRDLLEERARVLLGFADPRDYVIRVQHTESAAS